MQQTAINRNGHRKRVPLKLRLGQNRSKLFNKAPRLHKRIGTKLVWTVNLRTSVVYWFSGAQSETRSRFDLVCYVAVAFCIFWKKNRGMVLFALPFPKLRGTKQRIKQYEATAKSPLLGRETRMWMWKEFDWLQCFTSQIEAIVVGDKWWVVVGLMYWRLRNFLFHQRFSKFLRLSNYVFF